MHLMFTLSPEGKRIYTLKKAVDGVVSLSAHPARFSPDDKMSRQRVTLKKRCVAARGGRAGGRRQLRARSLAPTLLPPRARARTPTLTPLPHAHASYPLRRFDLNPVKPSTFAQ